MAELPVCLQQSKCILHIDLDCYFCQVEQVRLGLSPDKPVAVQQWSNLIAVNYAARDFGVSRLVTVDQAKELCPDITLVHVATFAPNETVAKYHDKPSRSTHKVDLSPYRHASKKIFNVFSAHCPLLQKMGSDEAFLDVTDLANKRLSEQYIPQHPELLDHLDDLLLPEQHVVDWDNVAFMVRSQAEKRHEQDNTFRWDKTSWKDLQLYAGAAIAAEIRKDIFDTLHYTCSAGVAHNKVLSKLCSSMHKPNKQTILRDHIAQEFMQNIPFKKIRNLGGKLGDQIEEEYQLSMAGDLWKYEKKELQQKFGESTGAWIYDIVRGIDHEEVQVAKAPKSLIASKSMYPVVEAEEALIPWFGVLAAELYTRIMEHWDANRLYPKTMTMTYKCTRDTKYRSKSMAMIHRGQLKSPDNLRERIEKLAYSAGLKDMLPCTLLSAHVSGLVPDASLTSHTISSYFSVAPSSEPPLIGSSTVSTTSPSSPSPTASPSTTFAKNVSQADHSSPISWICDRCNNTIPLEQVDEHTDFHFVQDLVDQERASNIPHSSQQKRPSTSSSTSTTSSKKPRRSFFSPE
ncbi:hypothetical protein DM01DRAFT_1329154, partial [Hesseltinella vesiculosa]